MRIMSKKRKEKKSPVVEFLLVVHDHYYDDKAKVEDYTRKMRVVELQQVYRLISQAFNSLCKEYEKRGYIQ